MLSDPLSIAYLEHLANERTPANTIRARGRVLRSLGNAGTATRDDVEAWWSTRRELAPATRANDLACLRTFYRWAMRWEHRTDDPTIRLDAPKVPNRLPRPMARRDFHSLLEKLQPDLRRAVVLGAYAGLRISEVWSLDWSMIDLDLRRARVTGKGGKTRLVAMSKALVDELLPETGGNVVAAGEKPASDSNTLDRRVNRAIRAAGVDATFHQLRHLYGTTAYRATKDLRAVGDQMGHSSVTTTAGYAAANDEVADEIADAVSI